MSSNKTKMEIQKNILLAKYTTFKIGGPASFFCVVKTEQDLLDAVKYAKDNNLPIFVLGGGSNIIIDDKGYSGLVIKVEFKGINYAGSRVSAAAGEVWDDLVADAVSKGLAGLENLSWIPGTVGAAPVQNIGAYGAEVSNTIYSVRVLDTSNMTFIDLLNHDCDFKYRSSVFKLEKGRYIIVSVSFDLYSENKINSTYKELKDYLSNKNITTPKLKDVRDAVIDIRRNKLPDLNEWGTAGSFFKNPIISIGDYDVLKIKYPDMVVFPSDMDHVKVSLGWILDRVCGLKGVCSGNVCTYSKQALVIVTKPGATSDEVRIFTEDIVSKVKEKTGILIEREVEVVK